MLARISSKLSISKLRFGAAGGSAPERVGACRETLIPLLGQGTADPHALRR